MLTPVPSLCCCSCILTRQPDTVHSAGAAVRLASRLPGLLSRVWTRTCLCGRGLFAGRSSWLSRTHSPRGCCPLVLAWGPQRRPELRFEGLEFVFEVILGTHKRGGRETERAANTDKLMSSRWKQDSAPSETSGRGCGSSLGVALPMVQVSWRIYPPPQSFMIKGCS